MCSSSTGLCDMCGSEPSCTVDSDKPKCWKSDLSAVADPEEGDAKCGVSKNGIHRLTD